MPSYLRSVLVLLVAVTVSVGVTTLPSRAAEQSKDLQDRIRKLEKTVAKLEAKLAYVRVDQDPIDGLSGPHVIFEGCNVHIRSGSGDTADGTVDFLTRTPIPETSPLGLGNLVVGYNEEPVLSGDGTERGGSHNLIVGIGHNYPNVAGVVFGHENKAIGPLATVTGGYHNGATGFTSSISGGSSNTASGPDSSVGGGGGNTASGYISSVSGGGLNTASGIYASVSGGYVHSALANFNWAAGALFQDF